ncbi:alpha/beta hydrolase [Marinobacter daepoensis]|uniref:alpha/beta fold hydrolase n=1 Tax=Marinobacter daepoensis TaxID=262077 RepID=UPI001C98004E|nr:alpha/beta hydrolase [Marinobacter daepoensis]MBY6032459.1 alpha/beta hydrolase [Marinobacter daepoensis]
MTETLLPGSAPGEQAGCHEMHWPLDNITLAGLSWPKHEDGASSRPPAILLHGWLDNAMSFARLAPLLAENTSIHALDMAGHGHSGHRPPGYTYWLMDYVADLSEFLERHFPESERFPLDLIGHSLGGIVCALYAAAFPERVRKLVMIDSLGALSRPAADTIPQLRRALQKRRAGSAAPAVYPDVHSAARIREGGLSPLSQEAARTLVPRNMRAEADGYVWRTDARLRHPTPLMMTEEQVRASLSAIRTPALFVRAEEGLLVTRSGLDQRADLIPGLQTVDVPGGHHCHLDGDVVPVARAINRFLYHG